MNGLILGLIYSSVTEIKYILQGTDFLLGFGVALFAYSLFAFFVGMLFKRSGVSIILFAIYSLFIEPFVVLILQNYPGSPDLVKKLSNFLPMEAINNLIHNPLPRYILREIQDYVAWNEFFMVLGYIVIFLLVAVFLMKKRDL
jgi:hypothetical protein